MNLLFSGPNAENFFVTIINISSKKKLTSVQLMFLFEVFLPFEFSVYFKI